MGMLKEMDIFVRSHLTPLKDEQVSLMRARWERDKRKQKQPTAPPKRRRAAKTAEPAPEPVTAGVGGGGGAGGGGGGWCRSSRCETAAHGAAVHGAGGRR